MIKLHRTASADPQAVLEIGDQVLITVWSDLLDLRALVATVPPEAAHDEDYPRLEVGVWAVSGSTFGLVLIAPGGRGQELHFEAEAWRELARLLYVGDDLLMLIEVAALAGRVQSHVSTALAAGRLFGFQIPKWKTRQWRVPRSAAEEWAAA